MGHSGPDLLTLGFSLFEPSRQFICFEVSRDHMVTGSLPGCAKRARNHRERRNLFMAVYRLQLQG